MKRNNTPITSLAYPLILGKQPLVDYGTHVSQSLVKNIFMNKSENNSQYVNIDPIVSSIFVDLLSKLTLSPWLKCVVNGTNVGTMKQTSKLRQSLPYKP